MTVEVEDVNDNSPTFYSSLYTGFAREDADTGTNIINGVAAFDNDLVKLVISIFIKLMLFWWFRETMQSFGSG